MNHLVTERLGKNHISALHLIRYVLPQEKPYDF